MLEQPTDYRRTFCRLCPTGCGLLVKTENGRITDVKGDRDHPISRGYVCPKGRASGDAHNSERRLNEPLICSDDGIASVSWDEALDSIADKLLEVRASYGQDAIGFYFGTAAFFDSGAQITREFAAQLQTRSWYTPTSIDAPGWLFVAERMSGNAWLLPQPDVDADLVVLIGLNLMISHGHNFYTPAPKKLLRDWASRRGLWVIDPRLTETAKTASHHIRPTPGSEYAMLAYLVRELLRDGADEDFLACHAINREILAAAVEPYTIEIASSVTGVSNHAIGDLLTAIRLSGRVAIHSGTGVSMSRNANVTTWLIWVLNIITGSMDRPGGIWFNRGMMRDWNEVGWEPTNTSEPGPNSRPELPRRVGEMPSVAIADEIEAGNLRALMVIGGNPITAIPGTDKLKRAFSKLDALIVMDVVPTGTTNLATHILPCAGQFERSDMSLSEIIYPKELTQFTPAMVPPQGQRRPVWWIVSQIAHRLGMQIAPHSLSSENDVDMTRRVIANPRFNIRNLTSGCGSWRVMKDKTWGWVANHLPDGKWDLAPKELVDQLKSAAPPIRDSEELFLLSKRQQHKINSTLNDGIGDKNHRSMPGVYMNPDDALRFGLSEGRAVKIESSFGSIEAIVRIDHSLLSGCVNIPHGFEETNASFLTSSKFSVDRLSGMPELTALTVRVSPALP